MGKSYWSICWNIFAKFAENILFFSAKIVPIRLHLDEVSNFFMGLVNDVIDYREKNNVAHNDFMQLLIQLKNKGKIEDDGDIKSEHVQDETAGKET